MIDERAAELPRPPVSRAFIEWTHREFCTRLPDTLLLVVNPDTGERVPVVPGQLRARTVAVERLGGRLDGKMLRRFEKFSRASQLRVPETIEWE